MTIRRILGLSANAMIYVIVHLLVQACLCAKPTIGSERLMVAEDVLNIVSFSNPTIAPTGKRISIEIARARGAGENNARGESNAANSRSDIWLLSPKSGEERNISMGAESGSGCWAATWSPTGR